MTIWEEIDELANEILTSIIILAALVWLIEFIKRLKEDTESFRMIGQ
jgi:hypothetical protein